MTYIAGRLPKYKQLLVDLRHQIAAGDLAAGARLPTEAQLCARHEVARGTVRKAIAQLEAEGLVRTEHGVGSFVSSPWRDAAPFHFCEPEQGDHVSYCVVRQELVPATLDLAAQLKIAPGAPVIHIAQLQLDCGQAVAYTERYLPQALCPALLDADLNTQPVHDILAASAEPPMRAAIEVEARRLAPDDARLLGVAAGTPALIVSRMSYTAPTRPAVWYRGLFKQQYALGVALAEDDR